MEESAENNEDMPNAMIIRMFRLLVMDKVIDTRGIGNAFEYDENDGSKIYALTYRRNDIEDGPSKQQIEQERGLCQSFEEKNLEEDACERKEPDDSEGCPTCHKVIVFDDCHADGCITGGDEHVYRTMVQYT